MGSASINGLRFKFRHRNPNVKIDLHVTNPIFDLLGALCKFVENVYVHHQIEQTLTIEKQSNHDDISVCLDNLTRKAYKTI